MMKISTIRACMERPLRTDPYSTNYSGIDKPKFAPQQLVIMMDISGSTNNKNRSGNGGRGRFQSGTTDTTDSTTNEPEVEPQSPTPEIIIAECEGINILLCEYIRSYDMTGTLIYLIPFSSSFTELQFKIESNFDLYERLIAQLDILFNYDQGGTELLAPLTHVVKNILSADLGLHTHIILATDGQTGTKNKVYDMLNSTTKSSFSIFVIGAGSIQESIGSQTRSCANGIVNPRDHGDNFEVVNRNLLNLTLFQLTNQQLVQEIISEPNLVVLTKPPIRSNSSNSECDIEYLEKIAYTPNAKFGFYSGAFGDYSCLKSASVEWLDAHIISSHKFTFRVELNGIPTPLPICVSESLAYYSAVLLKTPYGHHLITPKWQIAIDSNSAPNIPDILGCDPVDSIMQMDYEELGNMKPSINMTINLGNHSVAPLLDSTGYFRIRQISKL